MKVLQNRKSMHALLAVFLFVGLLPANQVYAEDQKINDLVDVDAKETLEVLVKYKNVPENDTVPISEPDFRNISPKVKSKRIGHSDFELIEIDGKDAIEKTLDTLKEDPNVEYVQPDYELGAETRFKCRRVQDPSFGEQWGLLNKGQVIDGSKGRPGIDIDAKGAWRITKGKQSVIIGVLDNGIYTDHPDLSANIYTNQKEIPDNEIDDDNNGYIDDIHGWDFRNESNVVYATSYDDIFDASHGTHIAGVISAQENRIGVIGVAPNVKVLPLKFMDGTKGKTSDAIEAMSMQKS